MQDLASGVSSAGSSAGENPGYEGLGLLIENRTPRASFSVNTHASPKSTRLLAINPHNARRGVLSYHLIASIDPADMAARNRKVQDPSRQ